MSKKDKDRWGDLSWLMPLVFLVGMAGGLVLVVSWFVEMPAYVSTTGYLVIIACGVCGLLWEFRLRRREGSGLRRAISGGVRMFVAVVRALMP